MCRVLAHFTGWSLFFSPHIQHTIGKYRWRRMSLGISSAPIVSKHRMPEINDGLQGVEVVNDLLWGLEVHWWRPCKTMIKIWKHFSNTVTREIWNWITRSWSLECKEYQLLVIFQLDRNKVHAIIGDATPKCCSKGAVCVGSCSIAQQIPTSSTRCEWKHSRGRQRETENKHGVIYNNRPWKGSRKLCPAHFSWYTTAYWRKSHYSVMMHYKFSDYITYCGKWYQCSISTTQIQCHSSDLLFMEERWWRVNV